LLQPWFCNSCSWFVFSFLFFSIVSNHLNSINFTIFNFISSSNWFII
jgi:hypothetical protein